MKSKILVLLVVVVSFVGCSTDDSFEKNEIESSVDIVKRSDLVLQIDNLEDLLPGQVLYKVKYKTINWSFYDTPEVIETKKRIIRNPYFQRFKYNIDPYSVLSRGSVRIDLASYDARRSNGGFFSEYWLVDFIGELRGENDFETKLNIENLEGPCLGENAIPCYIQNRGNVVIGDIDPEILELTLIL